MATEYPLGDNQGVSARRRREVCDMVQSLQCESCGGSAAALAVLLEELERRHGYTVAGAADETETAIAHVAEHSAPIRELIDRAIAGRGWALVISSDGAIVTIANSRRQTRRDAVRTILRLHAQGKAPFAIARELSQRGIPTPRGAAAWSHETVRRVIAREREQCCE